MAVIVAQEDEQFEQADNNDEKPQGNEKENGKNRY